MKVGVTLVNCNVTGMMYCDCKQGCKQLLRIKLHADCVDTCVQLK